MFELVDAIENEFEFSAKNINSRPRRSRRTPDQHVVKKRLDPGICYLGIGCEVGRRIEGRGGLAFSNRPLSR